MKGDFSRLTFRPDKHYAAVLMQQGHVSLDSDWNEQGAIVLEAVRAGARDRVGPHGGVGNGFCIRPYQDAKGRLVKRDFLIEAGSYYVDRIRCENPEAVSYRTTVEQLGCGQESGLEPGSHLVYLDVWERVVTSLEEPDLRELALGGPDTSLRLQVVWRGLLPLPASGSRSPERALEEAFAGLGRPVCVLEPIPVLAIRAWRTICTGSRSMRVADPAKRRTSGHGTMDRSSRRSSGWSLTGW
jgi:hypothetical protein